MSLAKVIRFPLAPELVEPEFPDFRNLPFIKAKGRRSGGGLDCWSVTTTGSYVEDCLLGDRYAEQFLALTPTNGHFALLGWIVESMIENGPAAKGIRIGFTARVSRYAFAMAKAGAGIGRRYGPDRLGGPTIGRLAVLSSAGREPKREQRTWTQQSWQMNSRAKLNGGARRRPNYPTTR